MEFQSWTPTSATLLWYGDYQGTQISQQLTWSSGQHRFNGSGGFYIEPPSTFALVGTYNGAGSNPEESVRILTDDELKTLTPNTSWDLAGTDYEVGSYDLASGGTFTDQNGVEYFFDHSYLGVNVGNWWQIHKPVGATGVAPGLNDRFFNIGTNIYLDVNQTRLPAGSVGKMLIAPMRIQWTSPDIQVNMTSYDDTGMQCTDARSFILPCLRITSG